MIAPPNKPKNSFRVVLTLSRSQRIDSLLLAELRNQDRNSDLKNITRSKLKALFKDRKIQLKGQAAVPSSNLAAGVTYVDILGFEDT